MGAGQKTVRGAAKVRKVLADEHREMQTRVYQRLRPYLTGAMSRLRRAYPAFQTVVFYAKESGFALVFGDGTRPNEAPKAFAGLKSVCEDLARLSEIEHLTASDALWQVCLGTPQPENVVTQYRYVENEDWQFWMRRALNDARFYMRQDIYKRTVYGAHRPGYGCRIVSEAGVVIDEWVDPVEAMIRRVLLEKGAPESLEPLCDAMDKIAGFRDGYYLWDVLKVCERMRQRGELRRVNPRTSDCDARYVLRAPSAPEKG